MIKLRDNDRVRDYLREVCGQVKAREVHKDIRMELEAHLEELAEESLAAGMPQEKAIEAALTELGDPIRLGSGLHLAHKPRIDWGLLLLVGFFIAMAWVGTYAVEGSMGIIFQDYVASKKLYMGMGILCMAGLYFFDYRKIAAYSWVLYALSLLGMVLVSKYGTSINGVSSTFYMAGIALNIVELSPYLLVISIAGISQKPSWKRVPDWLKCCLFTLLPSFIFMRIPSTSSLITYIGGYLVCLAFSKVKWRELAYSLLGASFFLAVHMMSAPYRVQRFLAFLHPSSGTKDMNYMLSHSVEAIRTAGWWGEGYGAANPSLPLVHSDMLFTYLIYSLGWIMGIAIMIGCVLLIVRLLRMARKVKDDYGKMIIVGLAGVIGIQFIWNMAMSVGWLPLVGLQLPFIANSGSGFVLQCCAVGLIGSIYRSKDMISIPSKLSVK